MTENRSDGNSIDHLHQTTDDTLHSIRDRALIAYGSIRLRNLLHYRARKLKHVMLCDSYRDLVINGDECAHGGDACFDAFLLSNLALFPLSDGRFTDQKRNLEAFSKLYGGITPAQVLQHQENHVFVTALNQMGQLNNYEEFQGDAADQFECFVLHFDSIKKDALGSEPIADLKERDRHVREMTQEYKELCKKGRFLTHKPGKSKSISAARSLGRRLWDLSLNFQGKGKGKMRRQRELIRPQTPHQIQKTSQHASADPSLEAATMSSPPSCSMHNQTYSHTPDTRFMARILGPIPEEPEPPQQSTHRAAVSDFTEPSRPGFLDNLRCGRRRRVSHRNCTVVSLLTSMAMDLQQTTQRLSRGRRAQSALLDLPS